MLNVRNGALMALLLLLATPVMAQQVATGLNGQVLIRMATPCLARPSKLSTNQPEPLA